MTEPPWVRHAIWWHVYPLGFTGAFPAVDPPAPQEHRLRRVTAWLDHVVTLGTSGIALGPMFASRTHGYDTTDHYRIDPRLGTGDDFDELAEQAHATGVRVLLDGVFNHVGTEFPHYRRALDGDAGARRWFRESRDGFATFEGHSELIALNHDEPEVIDYVVDVMGHWLDRGADGWRLDAAYAVPARFWAQVLPRVRERHPDAWFVGEVIHGDYAAVVSESGFDAVTQYELWKATWSALNDGNFHELDHALGRHAKFLETFVPLTFVGNHDVTRIASRLADPRHVAHALVLLMTTGGVPTIYAGDEFGLHGVKEERAGGDDAVRPEFGAPPMPVDDAGAQLFALHQFLIGLRRRHAWLHRARTTVLHLDNRCYVYETRCGEESLVVALSVSDTPVGVRLPAPVTVIAGSGAPPEQTLTDLVVPPHGWLVAAPH